MKPYQFKMTTGAIYIGFPEEAQGSNWIDVVGACSSVFISTESRYDLRGLFTSTESVELNMACVQLRQECNDYTDSTFAYCRYLGTLIAAMRDEGSTVPETFLEYIKYIDPTFKEAFDGVGIIDAGSYDFAVIYETDDRERLKLKLEKIAREYREGKMTDEEKACSSNVVAIHFGSNKNAPEKG